MIFITKTGAVVILLPKIVGVLVGEWKDFLTLLTLKGTTVLDLREMSLLITEVQLNNPSIPLKVK